jgi:hypothetical protein
METGVQALLLLREEMEDVVMALHTRQKSFVCVPPFKSVFFPEIT